MRRAQQVILRTRCRDAHPRQARVRMISARPGLLAPLPARHRVAGTRTVSVSAVSDEFTRLLSQARGGADAGAAEVASQASAVGKSVATSLAATAEPVEQMLASAGVPLPYAAGAAAVVLLLAALGLGASGQQSGSSTPQPATPAAKKAPEYVPQNAVMVVGASGRVGREVVQALLQSGRNVVAAGLRKDKLAEVLGKEMGAKAGPEALGKGTGGLAMREVDVTKPDTLSAAVFRGVTQVVVTTGSIFGRREDGTMAYLQDMSPERVDAVGNKNLAAAIAQFVPKAKQDTKEVVDAAANWERLDDVIMGGKSSSQAVAADGVLTWTGELIVEGGGFCGCRASVGPTPVDLSAYDGLSFRVRGSPQRFKINIKTVNVQDQPERVYQAVFDVAEGQWTEVRLPWRAFVPVRKNRTDPDLPALDPSAVVSVGLVYSRFAFNSFPSDRYQPGPFQLELEGGVQAYRQPRPQVVMLSSAGVERNVRHGANEMLRAMDVPIVQLNPGGVLNHKYVGENAYRLSGLDYAVVRSTAQITGDPEDQDTGLFVEFGQGDAMTGGITRPDLAQVLLAALSAPEAVGKTVEVRKASGPKDLRMLVGPTSVAQELSRAVRDADRTTVGLPPLPMEAEVPPPLRPERAQEILAQARVQNSILAGRGARVRDEASGRDLTGAERAEASRIRVVGQPLSAEEMAGVMRAATAPAGVKGPAGAALSEYGVPMPTNRADPIVSNKTPAQNQAEAQKWVARWKATRAPAASAPAPAAARGLSEYGVPLPTNRVEPIVSSNTPEQNRAEAKKWIAKYKQRAMAGDLVGAKR